MIDSQQQACLGRKSTERSRNHRWFWPAVGVLLCLFTVAIHQRNVIRAHWWAIDLANTNDVQTKARCLASIAAVGESASGAIDRMARHEKASVRASAVVLLARLPDDKGLDGLARLIEDADADVAESAAVSLAFMSRESASRILLEAAGSDRALTAGAAVSALSRVQSPAALNAMCDAVLGHREPFVRAQAVESLTSWLMAESAERRLPLLARSTKRGPSSLPSTREVTRPTATSSPLQHSAKCDPVRTLVLALGDQAVFRSHLALERQIAAAEVAIQRHGSGMQASVALKPAAQESRSVAQVAATHLAALTGRTFDYHESRSSDDQEALVAQCRLWRAEKRAAETHE